MNGILQYQNNVAPVEIGRSPCSGDTVWRGNVVMQNNTAAVAVSNNTVKGNLSVLGNNAAVISSTDSVGNNMLVQNRMVSSQVFNGEGTNNLQCSGNTSITGGADKGTLGKKLPETARQRDLNKVSHSRYRTRTILTDGRPQVRTAAFPASARSDNARRLRSLRRHESLGGLECLETAPSGLQISNCRFTHVEVGKMRGSAKLRNGSGRLVGGSYISRSGGRATIAILDQ